MVRGASLFDGITSQDTATVTIDGATIVAVGQERPPPGAEVMDLGDAALLPGLVDCHQHLCFTTVGEEIVGNSENALATQARRSARLALSAGITTIRDLGDRDFTSLPLRGQADLPTILCAGPPITVPQGHCWYLGGEVDPGDGEVGLRAAVNERVRQGCDVVKIMATGGFLTPTNPMWASQFSLDQLRIVVDEAHRQGLPVAAHCHGVDGIRDAVRADVDTIEHCTFLDENLDVEATVELLTLVAESRIPASVTIGRLPSHAMPPLVARLREPGRAARRRLHELGGVLVPGTDAGIGPAKPHDVMTHVLAEFVASGLSPAEALRAMTYVGAKACGVGATKGRLAPGYDADVLALTGNPIDDVDAIHHPAAIWARGTRVR